MNYIRETVEIIKNLDNLRQAEINLKIQIEEVRENLKGYKEINCSGMPGGSAGAPDDRICNLIYQEGILVKNYKNTKSAIKSVEKLLKGLKNDEKELLISVYCDNKTDTEIAENFKISRRTLITKKKEITRKLAIQLFGIASL